MGNCGPRVLEHEYQKHLSAVSSGKLWQDGHLIIARLGTMEDDKEDDSDLLDDKLSSVSFDFHQKIQMTHSFSF